MSLPEPSNRHTSLYREEAYDMGGGHQVIAEVFEG
jgi:hypothetical protein